MTSKSSEGAREWALGQAAKRFELLSAHLDGQDYLVGSFSVADAYLLSVLNWCEYAKVPLGDWPVLVAWRAKMRTRPSVAQAIATEMPLRQAA
jgi:glutathione S-transferase